VNLQAIVVSNGFGITLMLMLLASAGKNIRRNDVAERIFYGMIWATIALCAGEMTEFLLDGRRFPGARTICYALNTIVFALNIVFVYMWTIYIDFKLFGDVGRIKRRHAWQAIPMLAVLVMLAVNLFTPVLFTISPENVYARTPLTPVPFLVTFAYLIYSELVIYTDRSNDRRYLFVPSVIFLLPIAAAGVAHMLVYGLSLTWGALAISVVSVYVNIQCEFSSVDSLSGVYTRQYLDNYLREHIEGRRPCEGVMLDLDRFKNINDSLGHQSGDAAIRDFGHLLRGAADRRDILARYGGDEFILLRPDGRSGPLDAFAEKLKRQVDAYNRADGRAFRLSFSYGTGAYDPGRDTLDGFLRSMDESMYACKKARSSVLPERRGHSSER